MAHHCPTCGLKCHCGGDIDDLILSENYCCEHCEESDEDDWPCDFCGMDNDNHSNGCPNNHSPFNNLVTNGFD